MAGSEVKVAFQVSVEKTNSGETVFIVGDCPELGQWKPKLAKALRLVSQSGGIELWDGAVTIKGASVVKYRFFVGRIHRSAAAEEMVMVHKWESSPAPRSSALAEAELNICLKFGQLDGLTFVNRGWLTGQVAVHLSLHGSALKLNIPVDKGRRYFVKCLPVDTRMGNNNFVSSNETNLCGQVLNSDIETKVYVSNLNDDDSTPYLMPSDGVVYDKNAFLTFRIETWNAKYLGLKLIVSLENDATGILRSQNSYQELGAAFINQDYIQRSRDSFVASVVSKDCEIIGQLGVDLLVITSLGYECDMSCCMDSFHKLDKKQVWFIGHRGMGRTLVNGVHNAAIAENTISSLSRAIDHGADFVEFDVMLSHDRIPILHHDFVTAISAACKLEGEYSKVTVPVQNLNLKELETLTTTAAPTVTSKTIQETVKIDDQPFPTLESCLERVNPCAGFNVEIKYCMRLRSGELEEGLVHFPGRNEYVDDILVKLLRHSGTRRIILSSFDPDVCAMLRAKQNRYPVLFLTQGDTKKYVPYEDPRTWTVEMAFQFAVSESLRGVCVHSESLLKDPCLIERGKRKGLWVVCWGDDNNSRENIKVLKEGGVDGIILDRINEFLCS